LKNVIFFNWKNNGDEKESLGSIRKQNSLETIVLYLKIRIQREGDEEDELIFILKCLLIDG
jgi:hypothetical protein